MQDMTSSNSENRISRLPKVIETKECPECGKESNVLKAYNPAKKEFEVIDYILEFGRCSECQREWEVREIVKQNQDKAKQVKKERLLEIFDTDSLMNPKLKQATFENYNPTNKELSHAKAVSMRYAENFSKDNPVSLLLLGNYGTGKSHLSVSITKELMKNNYSCLFINTPKLLTKIRSTYNKNSEHSEDQIIDSLSTVDCLVLDDIGSEQTQQSKQKQSDTNQTWATSKLFEIIDSRIGKHTIFTTNFEPKELQQRLGGRNFSRMMEGVHLIKMYGDDYRLQEFKG